MKYLLDTHCLTGNVLSRQHKRDTIFIIEDVAKEWSAETREIQRVRNAGIHIAEVTPSQLEKVKEVLALHGQNFGLIRMLTEKGCADVMMLAYVLDSQEKVKGLFPEEWTIVTEDKPLTEAALSYGINVIAKLPL